MNDKQLNKLHQNLPLTPPTNTAVTISLVCTVHHVRLHHCTTAHYTNNYSKTQERSSQPRLPSFSPISYDENYLILNKEIRWFVTFFMPHLCINHQSLDIWSKHLSFTFDSFTIDLKFPKYCARSPTDLGWIFDYKAAVSALTCHHGGISNPCTGWYK